MTVVHNSQDDLDLAYDSISFKFITFLHILYFDHVNPLAPTLPRFSPTSLLTQLYVLYSSFPNNKQNNKRKTAK